MNNYPTTKLLFNRNGRATTKIQAPLNVEISFERRRKYVNTGIKLYKDQWNKKRSMVVDHVDAASLNKRAKAVKDKIDRYITELIEKDEPFIWQAFEDFLAQDSGKPRAQQFLVFVQRRIEGRTDIKESTRRTHRKLITALKEFGKLIYFSDLTKKNIYDFDEYLHKRGIKQTTIWSYHKHLKTYIHDAIKMELINVDPYIGFKVKRGKAEDGRWLSVEELTALKEASLPDELDKVRDMFLVQCYTGMAYADLMEFDLANTTNQSGEMVYVGERMKNGEKFVFILTDEVKTILAKYGKHLPRMTNQQYNMRLKLMAIAAGIDKNLASHWGRRTCGMLLLNKGVPIEIVSKVLGHKSIRTTQEAYAKILNQSVIDALKKIDL